MTELLFSFVSPSTSTPRFCLPSDLADAHGSYDEPGGADVLLQAHVHHATHGNHLRYRIQGMIQQQDVLVVIMLWCSSLPCFPWLACTVSAPSPVQGYYICTYSSTSNHPSFVTCLSDAIETVALLNPFCKPREEWGAHVRRLAW